jgi:hypothetical protein
MESNTQQHLMKMMTAYSQLKIEHSKLKIEHTRLQEEQDKLSSQVANLTLVKPVELTESDDNNSFTFNITSSRGWTSPPFSVPVGYTFSITHKEEKKASLMLLKGKYDDQPVNLQYELEILIQDSEPHVRRITGFGFRSFFPDKQVIRLSDNLVRVTSTTYNKEIADINLPRSEVLNYRLVVRLVPVYFSPQAAAALPSHVCNNCGTTLQNTKYCHCCGIRLYS